MILSQKLPTRWRGPFRPIATRVPGMQLCELLPRQAAMSDRFNILRSMVHTGFCHQQGVQQMFTGHPVREMRNKPDHPDCFSVVSRLREDPLRAIPNYVGVPGVPYVGPAYLGVNFEPFSVGGNLNAPTFGCRISAWPRGRNRSGSKGGSACDGSSIDCGVLST